MSATTEVLKNKIAPDKGVSPVVQFRDYLEKGKHQIANALPKHLTADRMIRLACTEFSKNPALQKCDQTSMFGAIIQASQLGLEIGALGQAYLIPFRNNKTGKTEVQFIPGYKGLISLARRSGEVTSIETHIVYEKDIFDLELGIDTAIKHKPCLDGDRGAPKLVYGVAKFKNGGHHFEWMGIADVNKIRARSKASTSGPWVTDYEQMVRKTVIRRMMNYLPMSIELAAALDLSDAVDNGKKAAIDSSFIVVAEDNEAVVETIREDQLYDKYLLGKTLNSIAQAKTKTELDGIGFGGLDKDQAKTAQAAWRKRLSELEAKPVDWVQAINECGDKNTLISMLDSMPESAQMENSDLIDERLDALRD